MKQNKLIIAILLSAVGFGGVQARTISTPLPLYQGYAHYPINRWDPVDNCAGMVFNLWGAGYSRTADEAFGPKTDASSGCGDRNTNNDCSSASSGGACPLPFASTGLTCGASNINNETLTQLIFGKSSFAVGESFAGGVAGSTGSGNPFVTLSILSPQYDYREQGAFFGMELGKRFGCHKRWRSGLRARVPYRDIDMQESCAGEGGESNTTGQTVADFYQVRQETNNFGATPVTNQVFAARLDFLSLLNRIPLNVTGGTDPLVRYSSTGLTIGGQPLDTALVVLGESPFVEAIDSTNGSIPASQRWGNLPESGSTGIAADGTGLINLQRGRFVTGTNYTILGASPAAQSQLWIVPDVGGALSTSPGVVLPGATTVADEIANAVNSLGGANASVVPFLQANGIKFCQGGRRKGVGDLDLEWYLGYQRCTNMWAELLFGVRVPTGKKHINPLLLVEQPLGNNGHVELRPGLLFGCDRWKHVKFHMDLTYSFVLQRIEHLPASFLGATIQNLGPDTLGKVSWHYFWGLFEATFLHPQNDALGATLAYEVYAKQSDKVCFCQKQAADFNGNLQTLDPRILACNTNRIAHKVRGELFCAAKCCNLFAGFSHTIAGRNITKDTDWYLGLTVDF